MNDTVLVGLRNAVDRSSRIPCYYQLREYLAQLIQLGKLEMGDQVPTEQEFCDATGLSRSVVRQALHELVNDGYLVRYRAKGTFVAKPKLRERLVQTLSGFYEDSVARGHIPRTEVLQFDIIPAPMRVAQELELVPGTQTIRLNRLRFIEQDPIVVVVTYIPHEICPALLDEDMTSQSLYRILEERFGLFIARGRRTVEAVPATPDDAELLEIEPGDPVLLLQSTSYLANGRAIEYFVARHRADRATFEVELVRERAPLQKGGHAPS